MVIVSWIRFFGYFLVIRQISKLLMTLIRMLYDTLAFIFVVFCYLIIATTIFTLLFGNDNPESYGTLSLALRTVENAMIG